MSTTEQGPREEILGVIPVTAKLAVGSEKLNLVLTSSRLIITHIGKRGTTSMATGWFMGRLSSAIEDIVKGGRESRKTRRTEESSPQELLEADQDNFDINYREVVSVELDTLPSVVAITILTREQKLDFLTTEAFDTVVKPFRAALDEKLTAKQ